jgi:tRNA1(Val) A37 N6-methylase TrmN6
VTPRCWPTSRALDGQLADMTFCNPPYNVEYANTPKDKHRGKHRPILNDDLGGDLAGASRLDR